MTEPRPAPGTTSPPAAPGGGGRGSARRRLADPAMRALARLLIRVFFRQVEVEGAERLPVHQPLVVVANHTNGLVDGLLLIAELGRYPRLVGKDTLWRILPLRPFLRLAGVVPIHRPADGDPGPGAPGAGNDRAFADCRRLLAGGGVVALFPEGVSHDQPSLQPLRTGAARIALDALSATATAAGSPSASGPATEAIDPVVLAVGLRYDAKSRFRSRARVRIGHPDELSRWRQPFHDDPRAAVRGLTDDIDHALRALTADGRADAAADGPVADARTSAPTWSRATLVVAAPVALVGAVLHAPVVQLMKWLGQRPANQSIRSTVKLLGCTALFALEWIALALWAGFATTWWLGVVVLVGVPLSGWVAVRFAESVRAAGSGPAPPDAMG